MAPGATPLEGLRSDLEVLRRRLAERESRFESHSMELLRCVLENAPDYVAMLAPDGTILFMNRVREGARTSISVLGTSVYDYQAPADRRGVSRVHRGRGPHRQARHDRLRGAPERWQGGALRVALRAGARGRRGHRGHDHRYGRDREPRGHPGARESEAKLRMAVDVLRHRAVELGRRHGPRRVGGHPLRDLRRAARRGARGREGFLALVHPDDRRRVAEGSRAGSRPATGRTSIASSAPMARCGG